MYLKVFKEDVIDGLLKAANIIPAKTGAAYLRSIWLKAEGDMLQILSTDSNIEFSGNYTATVTEEGLAGVQGRAFVDLVKKMPAGEITLRLEEDGKNLLIEQGRKRYKLPVNEATWFQNFSDFPEANSVYWSGDFLQEVIEKISFCISDEDTMEAIACLSIKPMEDQYIEACGLNGHQFSMQRFLNDELHALLPEDGILLQKKYLNELKKWLGGDEIELNIDNKRLFFRTGDKREVFTIPLSYYQYPDYNSFLSRLGSDDVTKLTVDRKLMIDALDRLLIFNTDNNRCTYFTFNGSEVELASQGQEVGIAKEYVDAEFAGDIEKIAFPTRNLIEILNHYQSEKLTFILTGTEGPCGLRGSDDPEYTVIIMPMKIVEETYYSEEEV
ncbi:DNA polymerase III subunit beta [Halodesulfovibrio sp.]|jgi:DNA polymerase-3 subunit beta|uniref:DNA polymerase III subunit beta n=1 Tax=Halodesulfovibrio sp. TaxID=1912772 RepID=UPI0025D43870|nr:DNA polymerase III subunit beta [Halodesulfovibrio sp.]MCT4535052.1 DNA polymerase III subunit beta [Halodesulfovibrio sp.]MCT4625861.1 DNA polymerase III subunit beta [Halodesulfovibrio sp.]